MDRDYPTLIRHLLDKAESTTSDAERDAYTSKAEHLMARWGVQAAQKADPRHTYTTDDIAVKTFHVDGPHRALLSRYVAATVAKAASDDTITVLVTAHDKHGMWECVGRPQDIDRIMLYVPRIVEQARHAWNSYRTTVHFNSDAERRRATKTFLAAFGNTVVKRMRAINNTTGHHTASTDLVCTHIRQAVNNKIADMGVTFTQGRTRIWDAHAAYHGHDAGEKANITAADLNHTAAPAIGA